MEFRRLYVRVLGARDLRPGGGGGCHTLVTTGAGPGASSKAQSESVPVGTAPSWKFESTLDVPPLEHALDGASGLEQDANSTVQFSVHRTYGMLNLGEELLGIATIPLTTLRNQRMHDLWLPLVDPFKEEERKQRKQFFALAVKHQIELEEREAQLSHRAEGGASTGPALHVQLLLADYNALRLAALGDGDGFASFEEETVESEMAHAQDRLAAAARRRGELWAEMEAELGREERQLQKETHVLGEYRATPPPHPSGAEAVAHAASSSAEVVQARAEGQRTIYRLLEMGLEENLGWQKDVATIAKALATKLGGELGGTNEGARGSRGAEQGASARSPVGGRKATTAAPRRGSLFGQKCWPGVRGGACAEQGSAHAKASPALSLVFLWAHDRAACPPNHPCRAKFVGSFAQRVSILLSVPGERDELSVMQQANYNRLQGELQRLSATKAQLQAQLERGKGELLVIKQEAAGAKFMHNVYASRVKKMVSERREISQEMTALQQERALLHGENMKRKPSRPENAYHALTSASEETVANQLKALEEAEARHQQQLTRAKHEHLASIHQMQKEFVTGIAPQCLTIAPPAGSATATATMATAAISDATAANAPGAATADTAGATGGAEVEDAAESLLGTCTGAAGAVAAVAAVAPSEAEARRVAAVLEQELSRLQARLAAREDALRRAEDEVLSLREEVAQAAAARGEAGERARAAADELASKAEALTVAQKALHEARATNEHLSVEGEQWQQQKAEMEARLAEADEKADRRVQAVEAEKQRALSELEDQLAYETAARDADRREVVTLQSSLKTREQQADGMVRQLEQQGVTLQRQQQLLETPSKDAPQQPTQPPGTTDGRPVRPGPTPPRAAKRPSVVPTAPAFNPAATTPSPPAGGNVSTPETAAPIPFKAETRERRAAESSSFATSQVVARPTEKGPRARQRPPVAGAATAEAPPGDGGPLTPKRKSKALPSGKAGSGSEDRGGVSASSGSTGAGRAAVGVRSGAVPSLGKGGGGDGPGGKGRRGPEAASKKEPPKSPSRSPPPGSPPASKRDEPDGAPRQQQQQQQPQQQQRAGAAAGGKERAVAASNERGLAATKERTPSAPKERPASAPKERAATAPAKDRAPKASSRAGASTTSDAKAEGKVAADADADADADGDADAVAVADAHTDGVTVADADPHAPPVAPAAKATAVPSSSAAAKKASKAPAAPVKRLPPPPNASGAASKQSVEAAGKRGATADPKSRAGAPKPRPANSETK